MAGDVVGDLLVGGHRTDAVSDGLHPQGFERQLDFQVEVPLAPYIAGAAKGAGVHDFKCLVVPVEPAFRHGMTDSHFAVCPVCIKLVSGRTGTPGHESRTRHIGMIHPGAPFTLDAAAHIINEVFHIRYVELELGSRLVVSH